MWLLSILSLIQNRPSTAFVAKQLSSAGAGKSLEVTTAGDGSVWIFGGTDSGFEATTSVYYTVVRAKFTKR